MKTLTTIFLCLAFAAAGCGSKGASTLEFSTNKLAETSTSTSQRAESTARKPAASEGSASKPTEPSAVTNKSAESLPVQSAAEATARSKPDVQVPEGPPPMKKLIVNDLIEGSGAAAEEGDELALHYVVVRYSTGKLWSWDHGKRYTFELGANTVFPGWEIGLAGMKAGGRRKLIVPPDLVWRGGAPPGVGPGAALVYVVDLLAVN